jgi:hypothetical protein
MKKSELLNWLQGEYRQWEALLDQIGLARMDQPGVNGDWSMKDMIAHLTGWNHWLADRMQAAQRGGPKPLPPWPAHLETDDEINAWIYEAYRKRMVREVLDEMHQVHQQILAVIESMPTEVQIERVDPAYYLVWVGSQRFAPGEFFDHFRDDHEPDVRAWLAQEGN